MIRLAVAAGTLIIGPFATGIVPDEWAASGTEIAAIVAGLVGMAWLYRHVLKPFAQLIARALKAWEVFDDLPDTLTEIRNAQVADLSNVKGQVTDLSNRLEHVETVVEEMVEPLKGLAREFGVGHRSSDK